MPNEHALEQEVAKYGLKFHIKNIERPPFWSGFRIMPVTLEFWEKKPFRLHKRQLFTRLENTWQHHFLFP
jgi:pyridoxamine 5'-phosphate oxidase